MLAPGELRSREAASDLEALRGRDREHGMSEDRLEFVEDGLSQADGRVTDHAGHGAADRVVGVAGLDDALKAKGSEISLCLVNKDSESLNWYTYLLHELGRRGIGAARQGLVDGLASDALEELKEVLVNLLVLGLGRRQMDLANRRHEGNNLDAVRELEVLFSDRSGRNSTCRSPSAPPPAPADPSQTHRSSPEHCSFLLHC